jgi:hypothetical protein
MHALYELKEKLMDHLEEYSKKDLTGSNLEIVDKLSHTIKNLCKIIEDMEEAEGESYAMNDGMGGGSYRSSYARNGRGGSYRGGNYSRRGMSYADGRGRGSNAQRDSMGRYSSTDEYMDDLRDLMESAPDQKTRMEFEKFIRKMESM